MLDLLAAGRSVASLSDDLGVSGQTIYNWRRQNLIDRGLEPGSTSVEKAELQAARRRIAESGDRIGCDQTRHGVAGSQGDDTLKDGTRRSVP